MTDEICPKCGCTIGGGCPESTPDEIYTYRLNHRGDYSSEEIRAARIAKEKYEDRLLTDHLSSQWR